MSDSMLLVGKSDIKRRSAWPQCRNLLSPDNVRQGQIGNVLLANYDKVETFLLCERLFAGASDVTLYERQLHILVACDPHGR
jgi:hypothetical protein